MFIFYTTYSEPYETGNAFGDVVNWFKYARKGGSKLKDKFGEVPEVGDTIVYVVRHSCEVDIYRAEVLEVNERSMRVRTHDTGRFREATLTASNFVIVWRPEVVR